MDIEILLFLQNFRNGAGSLLRDFFMQMTAFGETSTALVIMAGIYWCFNKEIGSYLLIGFTANRFVNTLCKLTACVYRPWMRDSAILPDAAAKLTAGGYSFPSGHSTCAASLFGGIGLKKDYTKGFGILMFILMFLVAFSRIFLGVHTPQDILVGMGLSLLVMFLVGKVLTYVETHPQKDILIVLIGILLVLGGTAYLLFKSYPTATDAQGNLLIDGSKQAAHSIKYIGAISAVLWGWFLERRFIRFSTADITMHQRAFRLCAGILGFYLIKLIINPLLSKLFPGPASYILADFLTLFYITFLYPLIFTIIHEKKVEKN